MRYLLLSLALGLAFAAAPQPANCRPIESGTGVLCCCRVTGGGSCCAEVAMCGGFVPGCFCQ